MLREVIRFKRGGWYAGGNARMLEKVLGCRGEEVLYVGDHIFTDVNMAKKGLTLTLTLSLTLTLTLTPTLTPTPTLTRPLVAHVHDLAGARA